MNGAPSFLIHNQQQMSPEQKRQAIMQQFQQQIMGQPAHNLAQGYGQLAAGIGMGLSKFGSQGPSPAAPGGASPSLGTSLRNFFTGRQNGGLY